MEKGNLKEREYVASKEDVLNFIARKAYTHRNMRAAETEDWKKISSDEYQIVLDTATFFLILT